MAKVDKKYLVLKPEVVKIFEDLEKYLDYCRFNGLRFDERDLYKSEQWRRSAGLSNGNARRQFTRHRQNNG